MHEEQRIQYESQYLDYEDSWQSLQSYQEHLQRSQSKTVIQFSEILSFVMELNEKTADWTNLSPAWNLMFLQACDFSEEKVHSHIDENRNHLQLINYNQEYFPVASIGTCTLCNQMTQVCSNQCGHTACLLCVSKYWRQQEIEMQKRQLYPKCFLQACKHKLNCLFIQEVCKEFKQLNIEFNHILSLKFLQKRFDLIPCKGFTCHKILRRLENGKNDIVCDCGTRMCQKCKELDHFPNSCEDVKPQKNPFYNQAPEKNYHLNLFQLACTDCPVQLLEQNDKKPIKCICGQNYCWKCFKFHYDEVEAIIFEQVLENLFRSSDLFIIDKEQLIFQYKQEAIEQYRTIIKYLQSNRIQALESRLLNNSNRTCLKLVQIKNIVADICSFLMNQEIYSFNKRNNFLVVKQQARYVKQMAVKLFESVLKPSINQSDLTIEKKTSIDDLYAKIKEYYEKLRLSAN